MSAYIGRFAPSPTGPLHLGSLLAALGSWLRARASGGRWLVRIDDIDQHRCRPAYSAEILRQLAQHGLEWDGDIAYQTQRIGIYQDALDDLIQRRRAYFCQCSRKILAGFSIYPGTCRDRRLAGSDCAVRFRVEPGIEQFVDGRLGAYRQDVAQQVGDFPLFRRDRVFAYQLAVVVDDAYSHVSDVVRGEDLIDNTPRQLQLQRALGLPSLTYRHLPLYLAADGQKLSKQNGARKLEPSRALDNLRQIWPLLGGAPEVAQCACVADFLDMALANLPQMLSAKIAT